VRPWSGSDRFRLCCTTCSVHCTAAVSRCVILECVAAFVVTVKEMLLSITSMSVVIIVSPLSSPHVLIQSYSTMHYQVIGP